MQRPTRRPSVLRLAGLMPLASLVSGCVPLGAGAGGESPIDGRTRAGPAQTSEAPPPYFASQPVFDRVDGFDGFHAPTIAGFGDGELLAAWFAYIGDEELNQAAVLTARRLPGAAWTEPVVLVDTPNSDANPVLYAEGDRVWLFNADVPAGLGWSTSGVIVRRSEDRGRTWSGPMRLPGPLGANVKHPPVRLANGELLLPAYSDLVVQSLFFASSDGDAWTRRSSVTTAPPFECLQPAVAVLDSGRVLAVMRNRGKGWLWATASDDDGRTWSPPADAGFPNPASPAALLRTAAGSLVLVFNDSAAARTPLSATVSDDDGASWTEPRTLVGGEGAWSYPAAVETPDGRVHVVYSHDRARIEHIEMSASWLRANLR